MVKNLADIVQLVCNVPSTDSVKDATGNKIIALIKPCGKQFPIGTTPLCDYSEAQKCTYLKEAESTVYALLFGSK